jgi:hypothetical protein
MMTKLKDAMLERPAVLFNWNCPSPLLANSIFPDNSARNTKMQMEKQKEDLGVDSIPVLGLLSVR